MKTKLFSLFLVLVASMGAYSQSVISVEDNSLADWNNLPSKDVYESTCPDDAQYLGLKQVKVYTDTISGYINIIVEPNTVAVSDLELIPFHILLNTDNTDETGGNVFFDKPYANIMLEGFLYSEGAPCAFQPTVFEWCGEVGDFGWNWIPDSVAPGTSGAP